MADPHWSPVAKDLVTTAGVLIGTLQAAAVPLDDDRIAVTLSALWRNRGPVPISLCPEHSRVEAFRFDSSPTVGPLNLAHGSHVIRLPAARVPWSAYIMEPNTDSVMHQHFVLNRHSAYGFTWVICLMPGSLPGKFKNQHLVCTRELLWRFEPDKVADAAEPRLGP